MGLGRIISQTPLYGQQLYYSVFRYETPPFEIIDSVHRFQSINVSSFKKSQQNTITHRKHVMRKKLS